ncbi:hypothetical protein K2173_005795 [Erythroxylum novogranatense]|uniref:NPF family transporter n=1 Tax=Erythroxylum novogranatense TaxID=1862640 RepID=A0AAV8U632_9ROSI|nr:hypothetical protein K2173_005795 [Erythroxylum novogranatense]
MEDARQMSSRARRDDDASELPLAKKAGGWRAIKYILGNESFEKVASMSLIGNMSVYLRSKYNMEGVSIVTVTSVWGGSSNFTGIAGAFLSDAYLGKFLTLLYGSISTLLGMAVLTMTASIPQLRPPACTAESICPQPQKWQLGFLFSSLVLLAIGAGGIRPCNIAFGADQFDSTTEKGRAQLESFFNWWYFLFTVALLVALTSIVYIQTEVSWIIGFALPTACLVVSISLFLIGRHTYIYKKPQGSVFVDVAKVIIAASRKHRITVGQYSARSFYDPPSFGSDSQTIRLAHSERFKFLDKAAIIADPNELDVEGKPKNSWRLCSVQQVEQLKCLVGILPVWLSGIGCFLCMDQQTQFGALQAIQTNRKIGTHFKVPPGWINLTSMIALSIWIFIYERIYVTWMKKLTGNGKRLTIKQRINIGILISILCMVVAAIVEKKRRDSALKQQTFPSPLSIAVLLPQFVLSGLVEAFAAIAIMEFLTTQMPESMRTIGGALFFLSSSIASYINSILVNVIDKVTRDKSGKSSWLGGHDLNHSRLDYYYYVIAGLGVLNFIYFTLFASGYASKSNNVNDNSKEIRLENSPRNLSRNQQVDEERGRETTNFPL